MQIRPDAAPLAPLAKRPLASRAKPGRRPEVVVTEGEWVPRQAPSSRGAQSERVVGERFASFSFHSQRALTAYLDTLARNPTAQADLARVDLYI